MEPGTSTSVELRDSLPQIDISQSFLLRKVTRFMWNQFVCHFDLSNPCTFAAYVHGQSFVIKITYTNFQIFDLYILYIRIMHWLYHNMHTISLTICQHYNLIILTHFMVVKEILSIYTSNDVQTLKVSELLCQRASECCYDNKYYYANVPNLL